jgi:hypothetical protein
LKTHASDKDLETAIKALETSKGSSRKSWAATVDKISRERKFQVYRFVEFGG